MKLPKEKLEEVEYYECYQKKAVREGRGKPMFVDRIILHYGEWEKEWKLFGLFTLFTETVEDRTEEFKFKWTRSLAEKQPDDGERMYNLERDPEFTELRRQLEARFDYEYSKLYEELQNHEIEFMKP